MNIKLKQEQKDLLFKDLCARIPYEVKVSVNQSQLQDYDYKWKNWNFDEEPQEIDGVSIYGVTFGCMDMSDGVIGFEFIKPYLFPLSSMTDEQKYTCPIGVKELEIFIENANWSIMQIMPDRITPFFDWLNKNHFDYRGLIEKGLSIDATNKNIY